MPTNKRTLGVHGENNPIKRARVVTASDFLIGGMIGFFERSYANPFLVRNMNEVQEIFGINYSSSKYGYDSANLFFQNLSGAAGKLYVKSFVGNTGTAIDAVVASATINDQGGSPAPTIKLQAAYQNELEYGTHGNRIGYKITNGSRFDTACDGAPLTGDAFVKLDSVAGIRVGDVLKFTHAPSTYVYKKVTVIDESSRKIYFTGTFGSSAFVDGDVVAVMGIRVQTFEQSLTGIVSEIEIEKGKIFCTLSDEVTDFYIENVFADHKYVKITDMDSVADIEKQYPADVSTVAYLSGGTAGTTPSTDAHWTFNHTYLNNLPFRVFFNPETTVDTVQKSHETYMKGRRDNPMVIFNITANQSKAQLQVIGSGFQRSDDVMGIIPAQWVKITDPFATSAIAPAREIPNVGAVAGAWLRSIGTNGIHYVPAIKANPIFGIIGIVGTQFHDDNDRTDLSNYGVNCLEYISGYGYIIRNFFTPSTDMTYQFSNGLLMRNYIKVSCEDSLQGSENMPNAINRISEDRVAILSFMKRLWDNGSTGNAPTGETFGISQNPDGTSTKFEDHVEVQADIVNNPQTSIDAGERNIDVFFTFPTPAGSIRIGVGIMVRS